MSGFIYDFGGPGIVYDHFSNTCNLTLVIETAAAIN